MFVINAFMRVRVSFNDLHHIVKALKIINYNMYVKFFRFYINNFLALLHTPSKTRSFGHELYKFSFIFLPLCLYLDL